MLQSEPRDAFLPAPKSSKDSYSDKEIGVVRMGCTSSAYLLSFLRLPTMKISGPWLSVKWHKSSMWSVLSLALLLLTHPLQSQHTAEDNVFYFHNKNLFPSSLFPKTGQACLMKTSGYKHFIATVASQEVQTYFYQGLSLVFSQKDSITGYCCLCFSFYIHRVGIVFTLPHFSDECCQNNCL